VAVKGAEAGKIGRLLLRFDGRKASEAEVVEFGTNHVQALKTAVKIIDSLEAEHHSRFHMCRLCSLTSILRFNQ
jgi:hypothetical protein